LRVTPTVTIKFSIKLFFVILSLLKFIYGTQVFFDVVVLLPFRSFLWGCVGLFHLPGPAQSIPAADEMMSSESLLYKKIIAKILKIKIPNLNSNIA
jgi:hypothetical protein